MREYRYVNPRRDRNPLILLISKPTLPLADAGLNSFLLAISRLRSADTLVRSREKPEIERSDDDNRYDCKRRLMEHSEEDEHHAHPDRPYKIRPYLERNIASVCRMILAA